MYDYAWYASRFGWTPAQVDELPAWIDARMALFMGAWDEVVRGR